MKKSKRLLSILLAVVIVVSSFGAGLSAFAANDPYQNLIDALDTPGVKNALWGEAVADGNNYLTVVSDPTGDIENAVKAFWAVAEIEMPKGHTGNSGNNLAKTARGVVNSILDTLQKEPYNLKDEALKNATNALIAFVGSMSGTNQASGSSDYPAQPGERNYGISIVKDLKSLLLSQNKDVDKLPEALTVSDNYIFEHGVGQKKSGFIFVTYYSYNYLKEDGMKIVNVKGAKDEIAALKAFGKHFTDKLLKQNISKLSSFELEELAVKNQQAVDSLGALWGQEEIINHFFKDKNKIEDFIVNVSNERDLKIAEETVTEIKGLMKNDPTNMDLASLTELLTKLTDLKTKFESCSKDAKEAALKNEKITSDEINAYIIKVNEEKEVLELQGFKKTVDSAIDGFQIKGSEEQAIIDVLKVVKEQFSMITTRTAPAIERVFPEGTQYIADFIRDAQLEIDFINLNEAALVDYFVYFNSDLLGTDIKTLSTNDIIDNYLKLGKEKFDAINKFDKVTIERVFGEKYAAIEAYIESLYTELTERITTQGNEIFGNYKKYNRVTLLNHNEIEAAIGQLETQIYPVVEDRLSEEFKADYANLSKLAEELKHYNDTFGVEGYIKTEMVYPVRDAFDHDIIRTPDEAYKVTNESLNAVISQLDNVMSDEKLSLITKLDGTLSDFLKKTIKEKAYTDATVNELLTLLYPAVVKVIEPLSIDIVVTKLTGKDLIKELFNFGVALYPSHLASKIDAEKYPEIKAALEAAGTDWSKFDKSVKWNVTDKESFVAAVGQALNGLSPILRTALGNTNLTGRIMGLADLSIAHMDLYDKAILPLLEGLEIKGLTSTEEFNKLATADQMIPAILTPLLNFAEGITGSPVASIVDVLPKIAYVLDHDLITSVLKSTKVEIKASAFLIKLDILDIMGVKDKTLFGVLKKFAPNLDLNFLGDLNELMKMLLGAIAPKTNIVLPTINQSALASHGQMNAGVSSLTTGGTRYQIVTDKGDTLLALLRYALPLLADSDIINAVLSLAGKADTKLDPKIESILSNIGLDADNAICAVVELFVPKQYKSAEFSFIGEGAPNELINEVKYSLDWSQRKADYLDRNIAGYVDNIIKVLGGSNAPSLSYIIKNFIKNDVYTNATVTSLVLLVKNELSKLGVDLKPIMAAINIDLSVWDEVQEGYDWGFKDGDKDGFKKALSKALSPLNPYLATVFAGEDAVVLSAVKLQGYNGYTNGIVPLLEAIGCDSDDILTLDEYKAAVKEDNSKAIEHILTPILNLLDKIYTNPVDELLDVLPNIIYFMNSGALNASVKNAGQAVFAILDTVRPIIDINIDLNFDVSKILVDLISKINVNGKPLNIKIPFLSDPTSLLVGRVTPYESKSGETLFKLQNSVEADFVTVFMRNLIEIAFYADNVKAVGDLLANLIKLNPKQTNQFKQILTLLSGLYKEINGVDKTLNAIYVLFKGTDTALDTSVSVVSDFNKRWSAVFEKFYESGDPTLVALAKQADETLKFLSLGFVDAGGIGSAGLITFGQKLASFFKGKVGSVKINKTQADLLEGESANLKVTIYPLHAKNKNVVWTSDNEEVAAVENGVVTAKRAGQATITATTVDGNLTVSCVVTVKADKALLEDTLKSMSEVSLDGIPEEKADEFKLALEKASHVSLDANATKSDVDKALNELLDVFKSFNPDYQNIESIKIISDKDIVDSAITVNVKWYSLYSKNSVQLNLSAIPSSSAVKRVKWSATGQIRVNENGLVTAKNFGFGKRSGTVTLTVEDYDGKVYTDSVKVTFQKF